MHGQFVWYDLMTSDPAAAQRFYPQIAGWKTQKWDDPQNTSNYTMWTMNGEPLGGVGQLDATQGAPPNWISSVHVNNIDESTRKAASLGAKVLFGPAGVSNMGRYAIIQDPQGATIALYQPNNAIKGFDGTPSLGRMSWTELMTTDYHKAFDFYRQLFNWEKTGEMDMGGGMMYLMFGQRGKPYGGMFNRTPDVGSMPPFWLPYIYVKDIKKTVETAKRAGGQVHRDIMDIPGGKVAILADPQGAGIAVHEGADAAAAPSAKPAEKAKASKPKKAARKAAKKPKPAKAKKAKAKKGKKAKKAKARPMKKAKAKGKKKKKGRR